jgi:microcystin-dependent protein
MPVTKTLTAYNSFGSGGLIKSSELNNNFSNLRGHIIPIDGSAASSADNAYDLGDSSYRWANAYIRNLITTSITTNHISVTNFTCTTAVFTTATVTTLVATSATVTNLSVTDLTSTSDPVRVPAGTIFSFGSTVTPTGYLLCDGSAVSRTTYAALWSAVGTNFGTDTTTTFRVPDMRGRFARGKDAGVGRDPDAGSRTAMSTGGPTGDTIGSVQADAFASHGHNVNAEAAFATGALTAAITTTGSPSAAYISTNGGNETRPENANFNFIIKT